MVREVEGEFGLLGRGGIVFDVLFHGAILILGTSREVGRKAFNGHRIVV